MEKLQPLVERFRVTTRLHRLECIKEFDVSGHSEPYIWPAFLRADATTLLNTGSRIEVQVPFETETGRGLFGDAGKNVKPGTTISIPAELGLNVTEVRTLRLAGAEIALVGFVVVLLEQDSTPSDAMKAGHKEFAAALTAEVNDFADRNFGFPSDDDVAAMKVAISGRVESAIRGELSWYHWFVAQDDLIGFLGGDGTFFTADRIRNLSGEGPQEFRSRIRGTERVLQPLYGTFGPQVYVEKEHEYDLFWRLEVEPLQAEVLPEEAALIANVEAIGSRLQELDSVVEDLSKKLRDPRTDQAGELLGEFEEKLKRTRPNLVEELALAWERVLRAREGEYPDD